MQINYKDLGQRIKNARKKANLTQAQLAERIGVGNTPVSYTHLCKGRKRSL